MSAITITTTDQTGGDSLAFQSTWVGGDTLANNGRTFLIFRNSSANSCTATFDAVGKLGGLDVTDPTLTVTNAADKIIGPFDPTIFNTAAGLINISYTGTGVSTTTVAAITN